MKDILDIFKLLYQIPDVQIKGLTNQKWEGWEGGWLVYGGNRNSFASHLTNKKYFKKL